MDIRVLGPVEVHDGHRGHALPGAGERALLVLLALHAGRVVSSDRLIDALWGEMLPANPGNALQLRVSKLRRWLAPLGYADRLVTRPPGYLLDVDPETVDARRAMAAIQMARELRAIGDTRRAVDHYRRAQESWRGPALSEFHGRDWADAEAVRLEEARLAATEERLECELALGRHADVLDELHSLTTEHPLRERLYGLRMLALYRSGRQADALATFQLARARLEEELGLDPSPELAELETAILRQDPELLAPPQAPSPTVEVALPHRLAPIVGRDGDLAALGDLVTRHRLVTVTGPGGAGKTTVAIESARTASPSATWFVALASVTAGRDVATRVADVLRLPPSDLHPSETAEGRLARQLRDRAGLLVLDNCEHVIEAAATLAERLVRDCPHLRILATSREALGVSGEVQYPLAPLPVPDAGGDPTELRSEPAVRLFVERARDADPRYEPADEALSAIARICAQLDGMPLAIELAAARVRTLTEHRIAERLDDRFRLLTDGPRTAEARHRTLRAAVDWSYELLVPDEQLLLRRLSIFRGDWTLTDAEEVCGGAPLGRDDVVDLVQHLTDRSLVVPLGGSRFMLLETIRRYAEERLRESAELDVLRALHLDRVCDTVARAAPELRGPDQVLWLERLRARRADIGAALRFVTSEPERHGERGLLLAADLAWFWYLGDHGEGRTRLHQLLDAVPGASALARGRAQQGLALVERPSACVVHPSERCAEAATRSIELLEAAGDAAGAALSRILLAVEGGTRLEPDAASQLLDAATEELPAGSWERALADFVRMEILVRAGRSEEGIACGDRAAVGFTRVGDRWGVSAVRAHQGHNLRAIGRLVDALTHDQEALEIARSVGLHNTVQLVAAEVGLLHLALGDEPAARTAFAESRAVARRYGYSGGEGLSLVGLGYLARRSGDLASADRMLADAGRLLRDVGSLPYLAWCLTAHGYVRELMGDVLGATACHEEVGEIGRALGDAAIQASGLEGLAAVAAIRGDGSAAGTLLADAELLRSNRRRPLWPLEAEDVERTMARVTTGDRVRTD